MNRHVSESDLALASGNDLPRWKAYLMRRHLAGCAECAGRAEDYRQARARLRQLAEAAVPAPAWLAERIVARAATESAQEGALAGVPWPRVVRRWAPAGAWLALACAAALLILWPAPAPAPAPSTLALATRDSLVGEARNALRRERVEISTGSHGGVAEVSATGSGVAVMQADPATGAVRITRLVMEE